MASPRKRRSPPLDADPRPDTAGLETKSGCEPPYKKICKSLNADHPSSLASREPSPACLKPDGACEPAFKTTIQPQNLRDNLSSGPSGDTSSISIQTEDTCEPECRKFSLLHDTDCHPGQESAQEHWHAVDEPAVQPDTDRCFNLDELAALEKPSAASRDSQSTPAPTDIDASELHDNDLGPDDFESLDELLGIPRNRQATPTPRHGATSQLGPVHYPKADVETLKIYEPRRRRATSTAEHGGTRGPSPASYTEVDLEMPKIDEGSESNDSGVIDLTQDTEFDVDRSDDFIGTIKLGTPGITGKRKGIFTTTATPIRCPLTPLSRTTPTRHQWDNRPSTYPGTMPSEPSQTQTSSRKLGLVPPGVVIPEDSENIMQPGTTSTHAPGSAKREDQGTPSRDCKIALVKLKHGDGKHRRLKRPADGSPKLTSSLSLDMAKFLVNEQKLAAMPCAARPPQLKTKLLKHQRQALQWMIDMEKPHDPCSGPSARLAHFWGAKPPPDADVDAGVDAMVNTSVIPFSGGILADDMGLGKTLAMIALIIREPKSGPTLIVAPKGVLTNWESQIRRHVKWDHAPRLLVFHGARGHATPTDLARNDIVITTFNKLGDESYGEGTLRRVRWRRVILDEGHNIRNPDSQAALAACMLQTKSSWVCTGTPIINSVNDIYSLGRFIGATSTLRKSPSDIIRHLKNDHQFLQHVMATICLRRTKEMSFVNLELPPKQEELIRIEFSEAENAMYQELLADAHKAAELFFKTRRYEIWTHLLERLLRLRQMCNHWSLCKKNGMDDCRRELNELLLASGELLSESQLGEALDLSLEAKIACGICSEPLSLELSPVIAPCAHVFCKQCLLDTQTCPVCKHTFSKSSVIEKGPVPNSAFGVPAQHDHSSKTKTLIALVKKRLRNKGSKIVIFSQWTSFLDIVAHHLGEEDIEHSRIDGTMSTALRDDAVRVLEKDPHVRVMLASLRAAGVGISLVAADTAILTDSWWAPAIEDQAIDRVHRLGQTRPTKVYRLSIKGAVEENVIRIQDRKRELVGTAFQEEFKALSDVSFSGMVMEILG